MLSMAELPPDLLAIRRIRQQRNELIIALPKALALPRGFKPGRYVRITKGPGQRLCLLAIGPEPNTPAPEGVGDSQTPHDGAMEV